MSDAPRSRGRIALVVVALVLVTVPVALWALRSTIATSIARGALADEGIECDDRFEVGLSATFGDATIGPTRCTHDGGLIEAVEILGDVDVDIDGLEPSDVRAASVRVVLRDADVRGGSSWAGPLRRLGLEQRVAGLVKGLAELGGMDLPPIEVATLEVTRGTSRLASAQRVALGGGTPSAVSAARIDFVAGPMGVGRLGLSNVTGQADASRVQLSGRAEAEASIAILRVSTGGQFTVDATGLDTASPSFSLSGDFR